MSLASTPTRVARGTLVPGIDTQQQFELADPWPLTPQSANDSRRSSLAFSGLSDMSHSGQSSIGGYSQPATPAHGMNGSHGFPPSWSEGAKVHSAPMFGDLTDDCTVGLMLPTMFSQPASHPSQCHPSVRVASSMDGHDQKPLVGQLIHEDAFLVSGLPMNHFWTQTQQTSMGFNHMQSALNTTLLSNRRAMKHAGAAVINDRLPRDIPMSLEASPFGDYDTTSPTRPDIYLPTQIIVPSQVGPHMDYAMEQYSACGQQDGHDDCSLSFESEGTSRNGWEPISPESSNEAYFVPPDDDGFLMIKSEAPLPPARGSSRDSRRSFESTTSQQRTSRRASKRARRSQMQGRAWFEAEHHNVTVRYEGPRFSLVKNSSSPNEKEFSVVADQAKDPKPHKCTAHKEDGTVCGVGFERSEHLKRHMGSHNGEKTYLCPVPDCKKRKEGINRPDNACQHFKTHLNPPSTGKRNKTCTFEFLESHLRDIYPEKVANKMLTNLRRWYVGETEKASRVATATSVTEQGHSRSRAVVSKKMMSQQSKGHWTR